MITKVVVIWADKKVTTKVFAADRLIECESFIKGVDISDTLSVVIRRQRA